MIEIDGVRRALEEPITEAGDYISDEYFRVIDLSTAPRYGTDVAISGLKGAVRRLNLNIAATSVYLRNRGLAEVYDDVVTQVNQINAEVAGVGELRLISTVADPVNYSGLYAWDRGPIAEHI